MQSKNSLKKQLIIEADDFGISESANNAILRGYNDGILTSTCIMANTDAFEEAMEDVLPRCSKIGFGIHLNVIEGKSLCENPSSLLCDSNGFYNNGYGALILKSTDKTFLNALEKEFRGQIEKVLNYRHVDHINSHVHVHAIPPIFELTCKLAVDYQIKYIRTQREKPYFVPDAKKYFSAKYPINLIKNGLLNSFSTINLSTLKKYNLKTNERFIGVNYTGYMDENTVKYGVDAALQGSEDVVEVLLHPSLDEKNKPFNYQEYLCCTNKNLKKHLEKNVKLTNYFDLGITGSTSRV